LDSNDLLSGDVVEDLATVEENAGIELDDLTIGDACNGFNFEVSEGGGVKLVTKVLLESLLKPVDDLGDWN
jgi:hypothetical protein